MTAPLIPADAHKYGETDMPVTGLWSFYKLWFKCSLFTSLWVWKTIVTILVWYDFFLNEKPKKKMFSNKPSIFGKHGT